MTNIWFLAARVNLKPLPRQAARTLEFVLDKYSPDQRTEEKLEMVLNIIRRATVAGSGTRIVDASFIFSMPRNKPAFVGVSGAPEDHGSNKQHFVIFLP